MSFQKPAGMLSQGGSSRGPDLVGWLRDYFGRHYVGLVHRLDRNTSGLMVVAKRSKAATRLTKALQQGEVKRTYQALLLGHLRKKERWQHWLIKDKKNNKSKIVKKSSVPGTVPGTKEAILKVKPIKTFKKKGEILTLAEFELETGRSHQIRVQAAHEGYPLIGDKKYGGQKVMNFGFSHPVLHAYQLSFPHPMSGAAQTFLRNRRTWS